MFAQKCAVGVAGGLASIYMVGSLYSLRQGRHNKPSSFELSGGSIPAKQVAATFDDYSKSYGQEAGTGIVDRSKVCLPVVAWCC